MPRNRKKWTRERKDLARQYPISRKSTNHQRFEIDSLEFMELFAVRGGHEHFDPGMFVRAYDSKGRAPGSPVIDKILQIGRDKVAEWARFADEAAAIKQRREDRRDILSQRQTIRLLDATARNVCQWIRQDAPDLSKRSVLTGTNNGKDPTCESDGQITSYKGDDNRWYIAGEYWDGSWSAPDKNGDRWRINVRLDPLERHDGEALSFHDEHEAHDHIERIARCGLDVRFGDRQDPRYMREKAARLRAWEHGGVDMKEVYAKPKKAEKQQGRRGKFRRVPVEVI